MYADIKKTCAKCKKASFWLTAAEQEACQKQNVPLPDHCPACRTKSASAEVSSALATLEQVRSGQDAFLAKILPDPSALFQDIQQLMSQATAPIYTRPRTFWEWWQNVDLQAQQMEKKLRAGNQADQLLQQRLGILRQYLDIAKTMHEAKEAQMEQHQKKLRGYLETLQLEEAIAEQQALRDERIKTHQLEEARKQNQILAELQPPPPVKPVDPVKQAVNNHRRQLKAKATATQLVISDFLKELQKVFRANVEDTVKATRIRAVLETYKQEVDALPKGIRAFLEEVEQAEEVGRD